MECIQSLISLYSYLPNLFMNFFASNKDFFQAIGPLVIAGAAFLAILNTNDQNKKNRNHEKDLKLKELRIEKIEELYDLHNEIENFISEISETKPFSSISTESLGRILFPEIKFAEKGKFMSLAYFNCESKYLKNLCDAYNFRTLIFKEFLLFSIDQNQDDRNVTYYYKEHINPSPTDEQMNALKKANLDFKLYTNKSFIIIVEDLDKQIKGLMGYYKELITTLEAHNKEFFQSIHSLQKEVINS